MKIKKTIIMDTKGIEIGDVFYKFPVYDPSNPHSFYEGQKLVVCDISSPGENRLSVWWYPPEFTNNIKECHDIFDFQFFGERENHFNFYVLDKKGRVNKEIEKRKLHVKKKLEEEILQLEKMISDHEKSILCNRKNIEIINGIKKNTF